jgi:hypothetical protein
VDGAIARSRRRSRWLPVPCGPVHIVGSCSHARSRTTRPSGVWSTAGGAAGAASAVVHCGALAATFGAGRTRTPSGHRARRTSRAPYRTADSGIRPATATAAGTHGRRPPTRSVPRTRRASADSPWCATLAPRRPWTTTTSSGYLSKVDTPLPTLPPVDAAIGARPRPFAGPTPGHRPRK